MSVLSKIKKIPKYLRDVVIHDVGISPDLPTFLNFSVSNRCNARCNMCDIWKHPSDDKKGDVLEKILSHDYVKSVESLGITGGEPFIRSDLVDVIRYAVAGMPKLKQISITTNGFNTARIKKFTADILAITDAHGIKLGITVSLDAMGDLHSQMRGVPGVWDKTAQSIEMLKASYGGKITLGLAATVTQKNSAYQDLVALKEYAAEKQVPIIYRMAVTVQRIFNENLIAENGILHEEAARKSFARFIGDQLSAGFSSRTQYYEMIRDVIEGKVKSRNIKCTEMRDGGMLDSNGDIYVCSVSGEKIGSLLADTKKGLIYSSKKARSLVRCNNCSSCFHDHQSHNPLLKTMFRVLVNA